MTDKEIIKYLLGKLEVQDSYLKRLNESIIGFREIIWATLEKFKEYRQDE